MNKTLWTIVAILVLVAGVVFYLSKTENPEENGFVESEMTSQETLDEGAVRRVVTELGSRMDMVSLSTPSPAFEASLDETYGSLVTPELLASWKATPANAPGRASSSPWPDRIEIYSLARNANGSYTVQGNVIEVTSAEVGTADAAAVYNVELDLENRNGSWLISSFTKGLYIGEKL